MADLITRPDTVNVAGDQPTEPYPADIRREWKWVKRGLEEILGEQPRLTFRPEDVYAAVVNDEAVLWVAPEGFVINTVEHDQYTGKKTFLIWLAWSKRRGENCAMKYIQFFEQVAKDHGFSQIETRTPISALETYFLAGGWAKETVIYTRDL